MADAGGGATAPASNGEAIIDGVAVVDDAAGGDVVHGGAALAFSVDLSPSEDAITSFSSFLASSSLPHSDLVEMESLDVSELDILRNSCLFTCNCYPQAFILVLGLPYMINVYGTNPTSQKTV